MRLIKSHLHIYGRGRGNGEKGLAVDQRRESGEAEKPLIPLRSAFATAASVAAGKLKNKRRNKEAEET